MSSIAFEPKPIAGLKRADKTVDQILKTDFSVQSVLVYGPPGTGATYLVKRLIGSWLCKTPNEGQACGSCSICRSFENGRAVDLLHVKPIGAGRLIRVSCIKDPGTQDKEVDHPPVLEFLRSAPLMARSKVVWIDKADRLVDTASHSLLKLLEELPPYARVVLSTNHIGGILDTIRSRCLIVACDLATQDELDQAAGGLSELERVFAKSPGDLAEMRSDPARFIELARLLSRAQSLKPGAALRLSEDLRNLAPKFPGVDDSVRSHNVALLEAIAQWLISTQKEKSHLAIAAGDAAKLINGNGNPGLIFDAFCAKLILEMSR
ncbi:MAG: AAA family ATPase [Fimbriimonadaceae bacterium]|jgi:hypothetical protein|nr:AAA family ATPase [Fimbriimonadaceae bacterium]